MGKHKDPDTLLFIDWLSKKGESLGFFVESEYALLKNEYFVDLVWKLRKDQDPLVTFEIETKDVGSVFTNTSKIFGTSSKLVSKPWRHFMIIYKTKLSEGHKRSLFQVINQHNILLFEDVLNDAKEKQRLEEKLETLKYDLSVLIERIVSTQPLADSIPLISKGLAKGLVGGLITDPEISISIKSRLPRKGGVRFTVKTETKRGELAFLDKLKEAQKTGEPFTIETPQLKDLIIEGKSVFPSEKGEAKLTVTPTPSYKPVRIVVPGTSISFEQILLRRIRQEGTIDYLSTEKRNLPFVFDFAIDKQQEGGTYGFRFEQSVGDVRQYLQFEEFVKGLNMKKDLQIVDPAEGKMIMGFHVREAIEQDPHWYDLLVKLAYIQEKTNHRIPAPPKITREDAQAIYGVIKIINTGEEMGIIKHTSIGLDKNAARDLITILEKEGKISNMEISQSLTYRKVLNEEILLGPSKIKLPDMKFEEPIEKVKKQIEETPEEGVIKLTLVPVMDGKTRIRFENWPT